MHLFSENKLRLILLTLLLIVLGMTGALAQTQASFEQSCWLKTKGQTTVYRLTNDDGGLVVGDETGNSFEEAGSIPGGTYVKITLSLDNGMDKITYWSGGSTASGYVYSSSLIEAVANVYLDDGKVVQVAEALAQDRNALIRYLNSSYSGATFSLIPGSNLIHVEYTNGGDDLFDDAPAYARPTEFLTFYYIGTEYASLADPPAEEQTAEPSEEPTAEQPSETPETTQTPMPTAPSDRDEEQSWDAAKKENAAGTPAASEPAEVTGTPVPTATAEPKPTEEPTEGIICTVETLGTAYSTISINGTEVMVPTKDISWKTEVTNGQVLAVISAPRTGTVTLHTKSSSKSAVLGKCKTGCVVAVLKKGKNYTKVWCDGMVCYVLTSTINSTAVIQPEEASLAHITFRGKLKSKNEMNVRESAKSSARILGTYIAGTPCTVFSDNGTWTEIEVDGIHCFIQSQYITLDKDL